MSIDNIDYVEVAFFSMAFSIVYVCGVFTYIAFKIKKLSETGKLEIEK